MITIHFASGIKTASFDRRYSGEPGRKVARVFSEVLAFPFCTYCPLNYLTSKYVTAISLKPNAQLSAKTTWQVMQTVRLIDIIT
jgi:hypothetical protein